MLGRGLAQAAETMRALPLKLVLRAGISELDLAHHYGEAVAQLYPMVDPLMSNILASHLRHATETEIVGAAERERGATAGLAPGGGGLRRPGRASPASARKCRRMSSGAWPRVWKRSRWR